MENSNITPLVPKDKKENEIKIDPKKLTKLYLVILHHSIIERIKHADKKKLK